ncbi:MAG: recombinase-like helix-turn-helix domain-containing protein [Stellaceae bacterium]
MDNRELGFDPRIFDADPVEASYREALADGIERVLERGADTLEDLVKALNAIHVTAKDGAAWTEAALGAELDRLGR